MTKKVYPLATVPRLGVLLIPAAYDEVVAVYDRQVLGSLNDIPAEDYLPYEVPPFVRHEESAIFDTWTIANLNTRYTHMGKPWTKGFPFGLARITEPTSGSPWTLLEGYEGEVVNYVEGRDEVMEHLGVEMIEFRSFCEWPGMPNEESFFHSLTVLAPDGISRRHVIAYADLDGQTIGKRAKMRFRQVGEPLDWEQPEYYEERKVRDRLNRDIICQYMETLGLPINDIFVNRNVSRCSIITDSGPT